MLSSRLTKSADFFKDLSPTSIDRGRFPTTCVGRPRSCLRIASNGRCVLSRVRPSFCRYEERVPGVMTHGRERCRSDSRNTDAAGEWLKRS